MVVTETRTPISVPLRPSVSDSMPTTPAATATTAARASGSAMNAVSSRSEIRYAAGAIWVRRKAAVATTEAPAATASPIPSVRRAAPPSAERRRTMATHRAASGPYSGPTTMAPTIRIGESSRMPTAAIMAATAMNTRNDTVSSDSLRQRSSISSHTSASAPWPAVAASAASAASDTTTSSTSTVMEPRRPRSCCWSHSTSSLAPSRTTSQVTTSPAGSTAAPGSSTTWLTPGSARSRSTTTPVRSTGTIRRRWSTGPAWQPASHRGGHPA